MKRWQIFLLLLVVAFIPYAAAIVGGKQLGPTEHIQTMVTADAPKPTYGWDVLQADGVLQFLPWRDLVFDSWKRGEAPILNPYQLAGQPLTANSQSGGFYPLHILFAFLPVTTGFKILLLGVLHLFIAGSGLYYFLRNIRVSETGSLIGAIAFALSQFMVAWAPLASVPTTVAWIPWILAGITCLNRKIGFFQVAAATAMMLYAGHLQFAFYGMFAAFVVWAWMTISERKAAAIIPLVGLTVGVAVAMPQLSLVLKNSATSHRRNVPTDEGYESYQKGVLLPFEALSMVHPKLLGDSLSNVEDLYGGKDEEDVKRILFPSGYWPLAVKTGANAAEAALWVSPVALMLALFGLMAKRAKDAVPISTAAPGFAVAVLGVLLAFGSPINRLLFFYFPGWSATGSPGRAHILIVLGLCILAAVGYDRLQAKNQGEKKWFALAGVPLLLLALGFNLVSTLGNLLGQDKGEALGIVITKSTQPLMAGVAVSALVATIVIALIVSRKLPKPELLVPALLALSLIGQQPLSGAPLHVPEIKVGGQERVAFPSQAWSLVSTPKASMPPNIASLARVHDLFGYDSILDAGFVNKLTEAVGSPFPPENGNLAMAKTSIPQTDETFERLRNLGVREPWFKDGRATNLTDSRIEGGTIEYDGYDHQIIKPNPGVTEVLIRDRFFEGMTTSTPGTSIENREGWRLIKTDGKQSEIRVDYPGRKNWIGVIIGMLILFAGYIFSIRKHEPDPPTA